MLTIPFISVMGVSTDAWRLAIGLNHLKARGGTSLQRRRRANGHRRDSRGTFSGGTFFLNFLLLFILTSDTWDQATEHMAWAWPLHVMRVQAVCLLPLTLKVDVLLCLCFNEVHITGG